MATKAKKTAKIMMLDDELHLADFVRIRKNGRVIWAVANNLGDVNQFRFFWDFHPFHETAIDEDRMDGLTEICKSIQGDELFTVSVYSGADCGDRIAQLRAESDNSSPEIKLLYLSDIKRTRELAEKRIRKTLRYQISHTFTVNPSANDVVGVKEKILFWLASKLMPQEDQKDLIALLGNVFEAWEDADTKLSTKLKQSTNAIDGDRLWLEQWRKFNGQTPDPGLPYYIDCDLDAKTIEVVSKYGTAEIDQKIPLWHPILSDKLPIATRDELYLPARKEYAAVLHFSDIPQGWDEPTDKYRFLWDSLLSVDGISDLELHSQISWASGKEAFRTLQAVTKQNLQVHNTAQSRGNIDKSAELVARDGDDALEMLLTGDRPIYIGLAIVVYAKSEEELKNSIRKIKNQFSSPCELYQEPNRAWKSWLQTTAYRMDAIATNKVMGNMVPNDRRAKPNLSAAIGLLPSTGIRNICKDGVEFVSNNGAVSVLLGYEDEMGSPWMGTIYGGTGSGKSVVSARFIRIAVARNWVTTLMDLPDGKSNGSYSYLVKYLGGIEIDTGRSNNNLLEAIDLSELDPIEAAKRKADFLQQVNRALVLLIIDTAEDKNGIPTTGVKNLLPRAISRFYSDPEIADRITKALASHPGTPAWDAWPTLHDFLAHFNESLNIDGDPSVTAAINFARERLRYWLSHPIANAIASPSDHDMRKHRLVLYSLRAIGSDEEGAVLGMVAQQSAERRSLTVSNSLFYVDEAGVMLKYDSLTRGIGNDFLTARKKGKRILIAMQTPNALHSCVARDDILQNQSYKIIGKIKPEAVNSFIEILNLKPEDLARNVGISANPLERSTNWIVVIDGNVTHAKYYADDIGLTAVLTNSGQVNLRNAYAAKYPDKFESLARAAADVRDRAISSKDYKDWEGEETIEQALTTHTFY